MQGVDAVDVEANIAVLSTADERGRISQRPARACVASGLQDEVARTGRLGWRRLVVQISSIHANALSYRSADDQSSLSAKTGVFVDPGKRFGKIGKVDGIVSSGREKWAELVGQAF
ncbi:MAG: hypothetical protein HYR84_06330 [Planctomycetes bacterium]|nr:hypothetical protein [Planctomycetota bacterium]